MYPPLHFVAAAIWPFVFGEVGFTLVLTAIITAVGSLAVAIASQVLARRTSAHVARLTQKLDQESKERDARRDYEYEAKKRLYEECEPLLFQAVELAESAQARILSLARTSSQGQLESDGSGWLSQPGYYFKSTAFLLLAPMTAFKILQRRLTSIDLSLEPRLREQYEVLKLLFLSFGRDFELARASEPPLTYSPDEADPGQPDRERLLRENPQVYARQGLYRGTLEVVVDALVWDADDKTGVPQALARCKTLGEFLSEFDTPKSQVYSARPDLDELFRGFHPKRKPVLWLVLVTQALLYSEFLRAENRKTLDLRADEDAAAKLLDWRRDSDEVTNDEIMGPLRVAESYLASELGRVRIHTRES